MHSRVYYYVVSEASIQVSYIQNIHLGMHAISRSLYDSNGTGIERCGIAGCGAEESE